jgi:hypothetical protein
MENSRASIGLVVSCFIVFLILLVVYIVKSNESVVLVPEQEFPEQEFPEHELPEQVSPDITENGEISNPEFPEQELPEQVSPDITENGEISNPDEKIEGFYGGYYAHGYPYNNPYPYHYPLFYSGCNENVFGEVNCLPKPYVYF